MSAQQLIVFYDGSCPLCSKEIRHYRKLKALQPVHWSDISQNRTLLKPFSINHDDAMRVLHVIDPKGNTVRGAAAFVCIWKALPGYRHLARTITALRLTAILDWGYHRFAGWRYKRRCQGQCQI